MKTEYKFALGYGNIYLNIYVYEIIIIPQILSEISVFVIFLLILYLMLRKYAMARHDGAHL